MAMPSEQLEAMRRLRENWDGYGAAAPEAKVIDLAQEFTGLIEDLLRKSTTGPGIVLHVSPTRVGGILIEWEDQTMQHEVELDPDCSISFLHLHKATGHIQTRKFSPGVPAVVAPGLLQELRQAVAA